MLVNILQTFDDANGKRRFAGENPDVDPAIARQWIADGRAAADTDNTEGAIVTPDLPALNAAYPAASNAGKAAMVGNQRYDCNGLSWRKSTTVPNYAKSARETIVLFGTSIVNNNNVTNGLAGASNVTTQYQLTDTGYFNWYNICQNARYKVIRNSGRSGDTSADMLARVQTDVIAYAPDCVYIDGPINDATQGITYAQTVSNLKSIYLALQSAGIRVIQGTTVPNATVNTEAGGGNTSRLDPIQQVDHWILTQAPLLGVKAVDLYPPVYDITTLCANTGGNGATGDYGDGAHPGSRGAYKIGKYWAGLETAPVSQVRARKGDLVSLTNPYGNWVQYCTMTGTGGTSPSANVSKTGTIPDGWWLQDMSTVSGGSSVTFSAVARTDKPGKNWWQSALTWTATQNTQAAYSHRLFAGYTLPANVVAGDLVDIEHEINYLSPTNAGGIECLYEFRNGSNAVLDTAKFVYNQSPNIGPDAFSGVVSIYGVPVPSGTVSIMVKVNVRNVAGTVGGCTLQLGEISIRKPVPA